MEVMGCFCVHHFEENKQKICFISSFHTVLIVLVSMATNNVKKITCNESIKVCMMMKSLKILELILSIFSVYPNQDFMLNVFFQDLKSKILFQHFPCIQR